MDIWAYFAQREREFEELSIALDRSFSLFAEEEESNGKRGRVFGPVWLTEDAYIKIHEVVVVQNSHVHREEYGYFLIIDEEEIWGEERDPTHNPPVHRHVRGHKREPSEPISFKDFVERAWAEVTRYHERQI